MASGQVGRVQHIDRTARAKNQHTGQGIRVQHQPHGQPARARLEAADFPALIVVGALDHPEVLGAGDVLAARMPHARKLSIPGCGQVPSYEQPDAFAALLLEFLDGLS